MHADSRGYKVEADHDRAEDNLPDAPGDSENVGQVAIDFEDQPVVVPSGSRPEPHPSRPPDESADHDHGNPKDDEAEDEREDRELALLEGVVAVPQRVGVDIRND